MSPISWILESKLRLSKLCILNHCDILKGRPRLETTRAALWLFYSIFYCLFPLLWSCCHLWKSVNHDVPRECSTETVDVSWCVMMIHKTLWQNKTDSSSLPWQLQFIKRSSLPSSYLGHKRKIKQEQVGFLRIMEIE